MSNNCSNCYNGCTEITSDKCVKYTGVDVPILGIQKGDSLSYVEQALITFLSSTLDGTGIIPVITPSDVCQSVEDNLPNCDPISLNNWLTALLKTLCDLENTVAEIPDVNPATPYDVECLTPIDSSSTIDVLQSVIHKVCDLSQQLSDFVTYVDAVYVKVSDINTYIQNYINTDPTEQLIANRMVPFSILPVSGISVLSNFDASGAGIGDWANIYLCNGNNGTPDLRGRVLVGTNDGSMGGGAMSSAVDPAISTNPTYGIGSVHGSNSIVLTETQIPAHTHSATVSTEPDHTHGFEYPVSVYNGGGGDDNRLSTSNNISSIDLTATEPAGEHTHTVTNDLTGGSLGHPNYQPGRGVYYIIYIP